MYVFFLILMIIYYAGLPLFGAVRQRKKPQDAAITEEARIKGYIRIITFGWGAALLVLALCLLAGISFYDIGLRGISLGQNIWFTSVTIILCGIYLIAHIYDAIAFLVKPKYREAQKEELAKKHPNGAVNNLLPHSKKERKYWFFVSLTAGVGEEIVFRGFLLFLLQAVFPNMPMLLALVPVSVIFGVAHTYQGIRGMIRSAAVGALFGGLFLVTGSLIPAMFLHFIVDISSVFLLSENT
ncbi:MAG: CPBP family intramembrane metalloprotease [Oscillospiraceae bacterium]|nr:CPBP family intramembrane metalloprotease [Oscillospiraceae bacterium]